MVGDFFNSINGNINIYKKKNIQDYSYCLWRYQNKRKN